MRGRDGFALLYAVLMIMALSLVGMGLMATGVREAAIAGALDRHARARARAEGAALQVVASWSTRALSDLDIGSRRQPPASHAFPGTAVAVTRLDHALYLVTAEASSPARDSTAREERPAGARARAAILVRTLPPASIIRGFPAALTASGLVEVSGGRIDGHSACVPPAPSAADSPLPGSALSTPEPLEPDPLEPAVLAPDVIVRTGAEVVGNPGVLTSTAPAPDAPDPFSPDLAPALADLSYPHGSATPEPVVHFGRCAPEHSNWGAVDPDHPCHALLPFIHVPGSITVAGGQGRGILVVDGDAAFSDGTAFHGIVLVHGHLLMDGGSTIDGAARAASSLLLDGVVRRNACAIAAALSAPALDRAFRPTGRWWLPAP